MKKCIIIPGIILTAAALYAAAVVSFKDFHNSYKPHNKMPFVENPAVKMAAGMDAETLALVMDQYILDPTDKARQTFAILITSIERTKAGVCLDKMKNPEIGINWLSDEYALDMAYYISEPTYNRISGKLNALANYRK